MAFLYKKRRENKDGEEYVVYTPIHRTLSIGAVMLGFIFVVTSSISLQEMDSANLATIFLVLGIILFVGPLLITFFERDNPSFEKGTYINGNKEPAVISELQDFSKITLQRFSLRKPVEIWVKKKN